MEHRIRLGRLGCVCIAVVLCSFGAAQTAFAQASPKGKIGQMDRESFNRHLRALGYKTRGGIARAKTESDDQHFRSRTHFSSALTVGGVTYPYTMWAIHRSRGARQSSARSSFRCA